MPITVTVPNNLAGPGTIVYLQSSVVGPLPLNSYFLVNVSTDSEGTQSLGSFSYYWRSNGSHGYRLWLHDSDFYGWTMGNAMAQTPVAGYVVVRLYEPSGEVDSGSIPVTLIGDPGAANLQLQNLINAVPSTFTATDSQNIQTTMQNTQTMNTNWTQYEQVTLPSLQDNLNNIWSGIQTTVTDAAGAVGKTLGQIFSQHTLDTLTEENLSGGVTCNPIQVNIGGGDFFYVAVHVTSFPNWYQSTTPGNDLWFPEFGVLRISRGENELLRVAIKATTHEVYPLPASPLSMPLPLDWAVLPPEYWIFVDWNEGVCGELVAGHLQ